MCVFVGGGVVLYKPEELITLNINVLDSVHKRVNVCKTALVIDLLLL